MVRKVQIV
jgi:hypothetical protein